MPFNCSSKELLKLLSSDDESIEQKITTVTSLKTQVKREPIDISEVASYFSALAIGLQTSEKGLYYPCFSCVCHLIRKTNMQDSKAIARSASTVIPILIDGMGDQKTSVNDLAGRTLFDSWLSTPDEVEKELKRHAFNHDNPKTRYGILRWLQSVSELQPSFPSRSFSLNVIPMLQDEDSHIRDLASNLLISMYTDASDLRKGEFQKALNNNSIRPSVRSFLLREIGFYGQSTSTEHLPSQPSTATQVANSQTSDDHHSSSAADDILSSIDATTLDVMEAVSVSSSMALEDEFANGKPFFEGKETELNWQPRERSLIRLRGILRGNAAHDFPAVLASCLQEFTPSIIKAALSLRTTLSSNAVQLIKDGFLILGMRLDAMTDVYLPALMKLTASTKKITIQNAHGVISTILARASYHQKALLMILACAADKNVSPRKCSAVWLKLFLARNDTFRGTIESNGMLDEIAKFLKRGLSDANPAVRTEMRETFWFFYNIWPTKGHSIMANLDVQVRKALEKSKSGSVPIGANAAHPVSSGIEGSQRNQNRPSVREFVMSKSREMPRNGSGSSGFMSNSSISNDRNGSQSSSQGSNPTVGETVPGLSARASRPRLGAPSRVPNTLNRERRPAIPLRARHQGPQSSGSPPRAKRPVIDSTKRSFDSATASSSRRAESPHNARRDQQTSTHNPRSAHERSLSATACPSLRSSTSTDEPKDSLSKAASMTKLEIRKPTQNKHQSGLLVRLQDQNTNVAKSAADRIITLLSAGEELPEKIEGVEISAFSDAFAKHLADPQPELSSFLVSCENIKPLLLLLPKDINFIAQAVLLDETDGYSGGKRLQTINQCHTLPHIFELTWKIIAGLAPQNSGSLKNSMNFPYFNSSQRKAAMHGTLTLIEKALEKNSKGFESSGLSENDSFGSLSKALLDALWYIRSSPLNYYLLISVLEKLYKLSPVAFDAILSTCQQDTVNELRRKWTIGSESTSKNQKKGPMDNDRSSAVGEDDEDDLDLDQLTIIDLNPDNLKQFIKQDPGNNNSSENAAGKEQEIQKEDALLPDQASLIPSQALNAAIKVHEDPDIGMDMSSLKSDGRSWYRHQLAKLDSSGVDDKQVNDHEAALDFIKGWRNERVSVSTYKGVLRILSRPIPEKTDKENKVMVGLDYNDMVLRIVNSVVDCLKSITLDCQNKDNDLLENSMEGLGQGLMLLCHVFIHNGEVMNASGLEKMVFAVLADMSDSEGTLKIANGTLRMALEDTAHCYVQAVPTARGLVVCLEALSSQDAVHGQGLKQYGRSGQGFILDCLRLFIEKATSKAMSSNLLGQSDVTDASTLAMKVMHAAKRRLEDGDPTVRLASVLLLVELKRLLLRIDSGGEDIWNKEINGLREAHQMLVNFYVSKITTEVSSN